MLVRAVVFDLGGVVTDSPFPVFAQLEAEASMPPGTIAQLIRESGPNGHWARLERGELPPAGFARAFSESAAAKGLVLDGGELLRRVDAAMVPRQPWLEAVEQLRQRGMRLAALTNNWPSPEQVQRRFTLSSLFDVFVESFLLGIRKPEPGIYRHVCEQLSVPPEETLFLDDLGSNLKSARALGMRTVKVVDTEQGLAALEAALRGA